MGYWVDLSPAYRTMDPAYIESVWWSLKAIFDRGLLVRDLRISPYCPRCGTPLSDHEMGQPDVYQTVADPSVTVRFPLRELPEGASRSCAAPTCWSGPPRRGRWCRTPPWPCTRTRSTRSPAARRTATGWWWPTPCSPGCSARAGTSSTGSAAPSWPARPTSRRSSLVAVPDAHRVVTGSFVTTADGTGLVHLAPAFGADDMAAGRAHGLPVVNPVCRTAGSRTASRWSAGCSSRTPTRG